MSNQEIVSFKVPASIGDMEIRVVPQDGEPWFVASDVAKALGYSQTVTMTKSVAEDQKGSTKLVTPGGVQSVTTISRTGFFKLALRAQEIRPEVVEFQDWVTRVVLPSIADTGGYVVGQERSQSPEELLALLSAFAEKLVGPLVASLTAVTTRMDAIEAKVNMTRHGVAPRIRWTTTSAFCAARHLTLSQYERISLGLRAAHMARSLGHAVPRKNGAQKFPVNCLEESARIVISLRDGANTPHLSIRTLPEPTWSSASPRCDH